MVVTNKNKKKLGFLFYLKRHLSDVLTSREGSPGSRTGFPLLPQFQRLPSVTGGTLSNRRQFFKYFLHKKCQQLWLSTILDSAESPQITDKCAKICQSQMGRMK